MFNKDSALAQSWKRLIEAGVYTLADVPELAGLPQAVAEAIVDKDEQAGEVGGGNEGGCA